MKSMNEQKKSVCIVTWYGTPNYGSNLQAIGFSRTLESLGYDTYFLQRFRIGSFFLRYPVMLYARVYNKLNKTKREKFFNPEPYQISQERSLRLDLFRQDNFKSKSFTSSRDWENEIRNGTVFACGSDILWNPARGYPALNFLDFAYFAKLPRFSYASSVGALELPKKYYRAYRRYLGSMKEIGVREQAVADMLEPIIGRKPVKVLDPSLLLTKEQWDQYASRAELSVSADEKGFILCYFVMHDPRYWEYIKKVRAEANLKIIVLPMHKLDEDQPYSIVQDGTPYEFLWLIKNATFICTDSFHACAASMIYHKDFYLLRRTRKSEDAKFDDFLNRYHLVVRRVNDENKFNRLPETDYRYADQQLEKDREFSMEFLKNALEKC